MKYQILPWTKDSLETERELGISHSHFADEYVLFNLIKNGESEILKNQLELYFSEEITMGRMTGNQSRQIKYWAVATIAVAVHYAILGGMDETDAFNASDEVINKIDVCSESDEIFEILKIEAIRLTENVRKSKYKNTNDQLVKKCIHYIHLNLNSRITLSDLAEECNISEGYLSNRFKKEMGVKIGDFIMKEKLENAKSRILAGQNQNEVAFQLGFCNESYFIQCFKKRFGTTPKCLKALFQ